MSKFILASGSPRRRELLSILGIDFDVVVSNADENSVSSLNVPVNVYVQELAMLKASDVAKDIGKNKIIISADTIVTKDGVILGKPKDEEDAFNMLSTLSGNTHEVYTGFCIMNTNDGFAVCNSVKTEVTFKLLTSDKIKSYIKTGEPMDKAGAYGIQGLGQTLISNINGDYFNVVGLPISMISDILESEFDIKVL